MSKLHVLNGKLGWDGKDGEGDCLLSITPIVKAPTFAGESYVDASVGIITLASFFKQHVNCHFVTVRYILSSQHITDPNDLLMLVSEGMHSIRGQVEAGVFHRYSDYTGYLWSDETMIVGGHDLHKELSEYAHQGNYIHMEITVGE